jgi:anti-sigma regulatory factor (Ser/Thr protein kinase)
MDGMTVLGEITLPGVEQSAADARRFLRSLLWGHPALDDLLVSACELLNNGLRHTRSGRGGGQIVVKLAFAPDVIRVEVTDDGAGGARPRLRRPDGEGGRGLHIVDALAERWGYIPNGDRTTVWAEFAGAHSG